MNLKKIVSLGAATVLGIISFCFSSGETASAASQPKAYVAFSNATFTNYHWNDSETTISAGASSVSVVGDGSYTCSMDFTQASAGNLSDIAVLMLTVEGGYTAYPNASVTIDSLSIDGTAYALSGVRASNDNGNIKVNLYNTFDNELRFDASALADIKTISISFTITGTASAVTEATTVTTTATTTTTTATTTTATVTTVPTTTTKTEPAAIGADLDSDETSNTEVYANAPTFSFDMSSGFAEYFTLIDADNKANMEIRQSIETRIAGGGLRVSCKLENELTEEGDDFEGIKLISSDYGLESFAGCKLLIYYYIPSQAAEVMDFAQLIAMGNDGTWRQTDITTATSADKWSFASLQLSADDKAETFGLKLPITKPYSGTLCYLDNIFIYDAEGNAIANIDGFNPDAETITTTLAKIETPIVTTPAITLPEAQVVEEGGLSTTMIIIIIVAGVLIAGAVVFLVIRLKNRFY